MKEQKFPGKGVLIFIITFGMWMTGFAQQKGWVITGKVQDSVTLSPVEYASVKVTDAQSGKIITGIVSAPDGTFKLPEIPTGNYIIAVDFLGYQTFKTHAVNLQRNVKLPPFLMQSSRRSLQTVTITSQAPLVENKIDKIVYNAANDITSQGGTAIDLLRKVPQVNVDIDGNVELQGNANIRFLINGKPSSIFGNSLSDALAAIPAAQIKSIEAVTSPGAKYDAQGTGGIINIILKDNKVRGENGSISLSTGTRLQNGSVNLNMRQGNFGINAFFSGNMQLSSRTPYTQNRHSFDSLNNVTSRLAQEGYSDFKRKGYQSGVGFDWDLSKRDNLSGSVGYSYFSSQNTGNINQQQWSEADASQQSIRRSDNRSSINAVDWSLAYKKKFAQEGRELNILYSGSAGTPHNEYLQEQTYTTATFPYTGSSSNNPGTDVAHNVSVDYTHKVNKNLTFETGVKAIWQTISSNAAIQVIDTALAHYVPAPLQSYQFRYDMKVYAGYLSASFRVLDFLDVKAGARIEHTAVGINLADTHIPSYNTLVPAVTFSHNLSKDRFVKLSYTRRLERPEYKELNPFLNLSDPYNITTGNPLLKPEFGNNMELGFGKTFTNGGNIYVALIERINTNDLKSYTIFYPSYDAGDTVYTNVSVTNRQNIGTEYNSAVNVSGSMPLGDFTLRGNLMATHKRVVNNLLNGSQANGMNYRFNLNASYRLSKDMVVEAFGNYNSAFNTIQGKRPQSLTYNIAFRKQIWNKNASIGLTATNPFNRYVNQLTTIYAANYISTSLTKIPYRSFGISFTYKFGKLAFKKDKEDNNYLNNPPIMEN